MAEWVVGQWVEWCDDAVRVLDMQPKCGLIGVDINGERRWVPEGNVKPFVWQVGKTYRTTLDGVNVKLAAVGECKLEADDPVWSNAYGSRFAYDFHANTGRLIGCEDETDVPHLLPLPADEPSEPNVAAFKPQASSPYDRVIGGVEVDLWTLADIYGITSHRLFSAWKKITMAGRRGPKDKLRDLREARVGLDKEIAKLEAEGGE